MPDQARIAVKIGFFGGSFDPVHFGHLCAAQDAFEQCRLDQLVFVPAAQAPLKPNAVQASAETRLAMLQLAIEHNPHFEISDYELRQGGISYTIDSVLHFRKIYPGNHLFWIVGADQPPQMPRWKEIGELARLIEFIVLERPGHSLPATPPIPNLRLHRCAGHLLEISSSELRDRARRGLPIDCFVPHKAVAYIERNNLYRP